MNAYQVSFPYSSQFSSFDDWNGNFIIWFGEQPIPYNTEANWRQTASAIAALSFFEVYPIPHPDTFKTWQEWADEVALLINGASTPSTTNGVLWINNAGAVVGWINNSGQTVIWNNAPLPVVLWTNSFGNNVNFINNAGQIVSWNNSPPNITLWQNNSGIIVNYINNASQTVNWNN